MRKNGAMFICNRCRKQVFAERLDDGKYDSKPLAVAACTAALCGMLAGCESAKSAVTKEYLVKTVYVYSPDGKLLDKGTPDRMFSTEYGARVEITMNGKRYTTNWGNVVMVEE